MSNKIYIDIQSLLDVRQSVLIRLMGQESALDFVSSDSYNFRDVDTFPVSMTEFSKLYESDDSRTLSHATITYMEVVVRNKISAIEKQNTVKSDPGLPELVVNTYPYRLTEKEVKLIQNAIYVRIGMECMVTLVYDTVDVWSPAYIKQAGVSSFFCYDSSKWLQKHTDSLRLSKLEDCALYFPSIGKQQVSQQDLENIKKLGFNDLYAYMEYLFASVCKISFLPILFYSSSIISTAILEKNKHLVESAMTGYVDRTKDLAEQLVKESENAHDSVKQSN